MVKRWPVIITGVIDQLHNTCHELSLQAQKPGATKDELQSKIEEGQAVIGRISKLKYDMGRDHALEYEYPWFYDGTRVLIFAAV